jgi:hypothetical protein
VDFTDVIGGQRATGFAGLAGSTAQATIRISDPLLNQAIAAALPPDGPVRTLTVHARVGNRIDVTLTLRKPSFLPAFHSHLTIERQPVLPEDPVVVLGLAGGAGNLLKLAGPFMGGALRLPPGIRLQDEMVFVDLRAVLAERGQSSLLNYVRQLQLTTDDGAVVVQLDATVR